MYNLTPSQAIVDGEPPDLPEDKFSDTARDFVHGCLNKIPKMRPTYAMLLRHAWLAPLLKPPTISEDEEAEKAAEAGADASGNLDIEQAPETADKEVAAWVKASLERRRAGKMAFAEKPALHNAPLDAVPGGTSMLDRNESDEGRVEKEEEDPVVVLEPNPGVSVSMPELMLAKVESKDFAGGFGADSNGSAGNAELQSHSQEVG